MVQTWGRAAHALTSGPVPVAVAVATAVPDQEVRTDEQLETADTWVTIVWNDPVNLMSYVTYVFRTYFGMPQERAERLMRQVHEEGRATVSSGAREQMETDAQAMHRFGLWATVQASGR